MTTAEYREAARRNTRARFEQWAQNPLCEANTISAVHNVRMVDVAKEEGLPPTFGQSPFAMARGQFFERFLFQRKGERLLTELIASGVLPEGSSGFLDLRLRINKGTRVVDLDQALRETRELLEQIAAAKTPRKVSALPALVAGAAVRIPKGVMLPEANLILDVLAIRTDGTRPILTVGEIKTYPDRGGYTDPRELAGARAQAGIYAHGLGIVIDGLSLTDDLSVSEIGFLVLTRPGSNWPSVRPNEELRFQVARAKRGFDLLEEAAVTLPGVNGNGDAELIRAVGEARTGYTERCPSFCDRATKCHAEALAAGDPVVLGEDVRRFVGRIRLPRVLELLAGEQPADAAEEDLMRRIRATDEAAGL